MTKHSITLAGVFPLEGGGTLSDVTVDVTTWGTHNPSASLICHALTADSNADEWWSGLFGAGRVFDAESSFIIATNVLGGCSGSTGPASPSDPTGVPFGADFPTITIRDMVHVQKAVLDQLGVTRLDLVVGGSMGGMQVVEWAALYPDFVGTIVPIGVGPAQSAWAIGISDAQRHAIETDPAFLGGSYAQESPPARGLETARMIAMLSYRSQQNFETRFSRKTDGEGFSVQSYLRYQGDKLVSRFDANSYLTLITAMDSHDLGRDRGPREAILRHITNRALVVGISSDVLYPVGEVRSMAEAMPNARFAVLDSHDGHDAFLIDVDQLNDTIVSFLAEDREAATIDGKGAAWA